MYGSVPLSTFAALCIDVDLNVKNFCSRVRAKYWSDLNNAWGKEVVPEDTEYIQPLRNLALRGDTAMCQ